MSFEITRRPEKQFGYTTKFSRWTAVQNPYIFEFLRRDFEVNNVQLRLAYHPTRPTIYFNESPSTVAATITVGMVIYLNCGLYDGNYTVTNVNGAYVTIDTDLLSPQFGGYVNLIEVYLNYTAYINLYNANTGDLIDSIYPKPNSKGELTQDVSGVLRSLIETTFEANQSFINVPNKGISNVFKIGYGYQYQFVSNLGTIVTATSIEESPGVLFYWLSAALQINGDTSEGIDGIGQNLKEYVPKNLSNTYAKFLTMFETPTYFEGFPTTLSFIYDTDFVDRYLERHQQDLDVNSDNVGSETNDNLLVTGRGYVNQMQVRTPNAGAASFDVWLSVGDLITGGGGLVIGGLPTLALSPFAQPFSEQ